MWYDVAAGGIFPFLSLAIYILSWFVLRDGTFQRKDFSLFYQHLGKSLMLRDFLSSREYTTRRNGSLPRFVVEFRENVSSSLSLSLSSFFPNPAFLFRDSKYLESWGHILCFVWYTECTTLEMFVSFLSRVRTFLDFLCSHRLRLLSHPFRTRRLTHINSCINTTLIEQTSYTLHSHTKFKDTTLEYDGTASDTTLSYTTGRVCTWCAS